MLLSLFAVSASAVPAAISATLTSIPAILGLVSVRFGAVVGAAVIGTVKIRIEALFLLVLKEIAYTGVVIMRTNRTVVIPDVWLASAFSVFIAANVLTTAVAAGNSVLAISVVGPAASIAFTCSLSSFVSFGSMGTMPACRIKFGYKVGTPYPAQLTLDGRTLLRLIPEEELPLCKLLLRSFRAEHRLKRVRIITGIPHLCRNAHRRRREVLHLFKVEV